MHKKPVIKFCTTFYNEFRHSVAGLVLRNDPALPIELMFDRLAQKSRGRDRVFQPGVKIYQTDAFDWHWKRCKSDFIDDGRNMLVNEGASIATRQKIPGKWTHIFFVDSDVSYDDLYTATCKMLAHDAPIVSGVYECKSQNGRVVAGGLEDDRFTTFYQIGKEKKTPEWCGMGFCLIRRDVFEKMCYRWFRKQDQYFEENGELCVSVLSEDVTFCLKARECGYKIVLDRSIVATHHYNQGGQIMAETLETKLSQLWEKLGKLSVMERQAKNQLQQIANEQAACEIEIQKLQPPPPPQPGDPTPPPITTKPAAKKRAAKKG